MKFLTLLVSSSLFLISQLYLSSTELNASPSQNKVDPLAEQFVKLGLELGQYDKDYVDAYLGPKQWLTQAEKNPRSKKQLAVDISKLLQQLKSLSVDNPKTKLRLKALYKNVRAMDTRVRMVNGESFTFVEEAKLIYDVTLPVYDFKQFDDALIAIDKLIPGDAPLYERVDKFRESFMLADNKVKKVVDVAIKECRKRSLKHIALPKNERFTLEYVTNKNWGGYNWYQGDNNSLMQINQDLPMIVDRAIELGCHEGYPGHHVWNVLVENNLLKANHWVEYSIYPLFSPFAMIAEGSANYGVDLAFPDGQKIQFERDVLFPLAGLDPSKAQALEQLNKLTTKLSHSRIAISQLYLDGEINRQQAIAKLQKYTLVSKKKATKSLAFITQYRAYVLNYSFGQDLVAAYIESQGDTDESKWKAFETMLTELSTASDMVKSSR